MPLQTAPQRVDPVPTHADYLIQINTPQPKNALDEYVTTPIQQEQP